MPSPGDTTANGEVKQPGWPDMPLIIEQLQDQVDALREVVDAQQRQIAEQQARLAALEDR